MNTAKRLRENMGARDWIAGIVAAILVTLGGAWMHSIGNKLDTALDRLARIETKVARHEKDLDRVWEETK